MAGRLTSKLLPLLLSERTRRLHGAVYALTARVLRGESRILFFHRVGDAWSWLLAQGLRELAERHQLEVEVRTIAALPVDCVPDPERLDRYAAYDAMRLARAWSFDFAHGARPPAARIQRLAERVILARPRLQTVLTATAAAWRGDTERLSRMAAELGAVTEEVAALQLARHFRALSRRGHYLGGMVFYEGEWFWGLDRLGLLEQRLRARGRVSGGGLAATRFRPVPRAEAGSPLRQVLEFYFSFRSPYSYLAAAEVTALADRLGLELQLRPLLPMVTRGVPVPARKLHYILTDAARVARERGVRFRPLHDPLGAGVERCLAVLHAAHELGCARPFMLAAMRAIWAEGANLARDSDLGAVAASVGIPAQALDTALASNSWRAGVEANAAGLAVLGLWGVPSFCLRGADGRPAALAWGQDRLWAIERGALGIDVATPVPGLVQ